ncbi:unnamed protein product [Trichobilharzia regenti]|nr:unnamed protein product [Trichobilharzia regenti]
MQIGAGCCCCCNSLVIFTTFSSLCSPGILSWLLMSSTSLLLFACQSCSLYDTRHMSSARSRSPRVYLSVVQRTPIPTSRYRTLETAETTAILLNQSELYVQKIQVQPLSLPCQAFKFINSMLPLLICVIFILVLYWCISSLLILITNYDPETHHIGRTFSVFITLDGTQLRLQRPEHNITRRSLWNDEIPSTTTMRFKQQRIYDLSDSSITLLPYGLVGKRLWSRKYPICITVPFQNKSKVSIFYVLCLILHENDIHQVCRRTRVKFSFYTFILVPWRHSGFRKQRYVCFNEHDLDLLKND